MCVPLELLLGENGVCWEGCENVGHSARNRALCEDEHSVLYINRDLFPFFTTLYYTLYFINTFYFSLA